MSTLIAPATVPPSANIERGLPLIELDPGHYLWRAGDFLDLPQTDKPYCGCALGSLVLGAGVPYELAQDDDALMGTVAALYPDGQVKMPEGDQYTIHYAVDTLFSGRGWPIEDVIGYLREQGL